MKIHEYQGKAILREYGVPVPEGGVCFSVDEAVATAETLGGDFWVVKAQIHAGGRGKGGGVKLARSLSEVRAHAQSILGMNLVTVQTGPEGQQVRRLLVEKGAAIEAEFYLGLVVDRGCQKIALMASSEGGVEIEEVAAREPAKIIKFWASPGQSVDRVTARETAAKIGLPAATHDQFATLLSNLYDCFVAKDATLIEINPLIRTTSNNLVALDAKINFDSNALARQAEVVTLTDPDEENPIEREATKHDLSYIALDGNIGCMVNGAGLAMATMDIVKLCGGSPANFLDVGGGASKEQVQEAFKLMLSNTGIKAILVNIFGGIMKCDVIATGVVAAAQELGLKVPLIVRLEGTNVELGRKILSDSGLAIATASNMEDAARLAVEATT